MFKSVFSMRYAAVLFAAFVSIFRCGLAFADGSRNMYPANYFQKYGISSDGTHRYRAVLYSGFSENISSIPFPTYGTIKVYAKAGEHIYVASSALLASGRKSGKIVWRSPDGRSGEIVNADNGGHIANRAQELAGPQYGSNTGGNRYKAYKLDVTAASEGVWEIDFHGRIQSLQNNQYGFQDEMIVDCSAWPENGQDRVLIWNVDRETPIVSAFDVSVSNAADDELIEGRVYANVLSLYLNGASSFNARWYSTFYMLTNTGYLYEMQPNGMNGCAFQFFANNKGVQTGVPSSGWSAYNNGTMDNAYVSCQGGVSAKKSVAVSANMPIYDPRRPDNVVKMTDAAGNEVDYYEDVTHKIFFAKPAADLPAKAKCVYGNQVLTTWLRTNENESEVPTLTDVTMVGKESGRPGVMGPEGVVIRFNSSVQGQFVLNIEFSDPKYKPRRIEGTCVKGANEVDWDGKDGEGKLFELDGELSVGGKLQAAEIHFPFIDVEKNVNGMYINLLDPQTETQIIKRTIYWNDEGMSNDGDGVNGINGKDGPAHSWSSTQRGNDAIIDTWTFAEGESDKVGGLKFERKTIDLETVNVTQEKEHAFVGEVLTYRMRVRNNKIAGGYVVDAEDAPVGIWFRDGGFITTSIKMVGSSDPNCAVVQLPSGDEFSLGKISLKNGCWADIEVQGYTNSKVAHKTVRPIAFIMRPGDYFEDDARNLVDDDGEPIDPIAEYYGKPNNNLKEAPSVDFWNSVPTTHPDVFTAADGATMTGSLLANDMDIDGDPITITSFDIEGLSVTCELGVPTVIPEVGTLTFSADGSVTMLADKKFRSVLNGTYTVTDNFSPRKFVGETAPGSKVESWQIKFSANLAPTVSPSVLSVKSSKDRVLLSDLIIFDHENDALSVQIAGTDARRFAVEGTKVYYIDGVKTREMLYDIQLIVSDGDNTTVHNLAVTVLPNQPPTIAPNDVTFYVKRREFGVYVVPIVISDPDGDGVSSSAPVIGSKDFRYEMGNLYFEATKDNTVANSEFDLAIRVSDSQGVSVDAALHVKIVVTDNGRAPELTLKPTDALYGAKLPDVLTWSLNVNCGGRYEVKDQYLATVDPNDVLAVGTHVFTVTFFPDENNVYGIKENIVKTASVVISKRSIKLISGSATRVYDGSPCHNYDVTVEPADGILPGQGFYYYGWGTITNVGTSQNTFDFRAMHGTDLSGYEITQEYGTLEVSRRIVPVEDITVVVTPSTTEYNGAEQMPESVDVFVDGVLIKDGKECAIDASEFTYAVTDNLNVGTATVSVTDAKPDGGNMELAPSQATFEITPIEAQLSWSPKSFVYDGKPKAVSASVLNNVVGEVITVNADGATATNVGNYTATATSLSSANYVLPANTSFDWSIIPLELSDYQVSLTPDAFTYDGTERKPAVEVRAMVGGVLTLIDPSEYEVTYGNNVNATTATSKATVTISDAADGNFTFAEKVVEFDIAQREVGIEWGTTAFTYDAAEHSVVPAITGIVGTDVCEPTVIGNVATNAGSYNAEISALSNPNYKLPAVATCPWVINPKTPTKFNITLTPDAFVYDGTECRPAVVVTDEDGLSLAGEFNVSYDNNVNATADGSLAKVIISDKDGGNFDFATMPEASFVIEQRPITLTSATKSWVYDGKTHSAPVVNVTSGSFVSGEGFAYSGFPTIKDIEKTSNDFNVAAKPGTLLSNYKVTKLSGMVSVISRQITPADVVATLDNDAFLYDGAEHKPSVTVKVDVDGTYEELASADFMVDYPLDCVNAGTKTITVIIYGNFAPLSDPTVNYVVNKRSVVMTSATATKSYDGTPLTDDNITVSGDGFAAGEGATYNVTGSQTSVGKSDNLFAYALNSNTSASNYEITKAYGSLTVSAASGSQSVTLDADEFVYNGTKREPKVSVVIDGQAVPSSEYTVTYNKTDRTNVGEVTLTITDKVGGNFSVAEDVKTYRIVPAEVSLEWGQTLFTYDGDVKTVIATAKGLVASDVCNVTLTGNQQRNAGTYMAKASALSNANYCLPAEVSKEWSIAPAVVDVDVALPAGPYIFSGAEHQPVPTVSIVRNGSVVTIPSSEYSVSYSNNVIAGSASVIINEVAGGNYVINEAVANFTVEPKTLTISWPSTTTFEYSGEAKSVTPSVSGVVAAYPCAVTFADDIKTDAGSYVAKAVSLSDASNYALPANTQQAWVIKPKSVPAAQYQITVGNPGDSYTYNGAEHKPDVKVSIGAEVISADQYVVSYSNNVNAGTAKVTVMGKAGVNYDFAEKSASFLIKPVEVAILSASQTWTYDKAEHSAKSYVIESGSFVGSEGVTLSGYPTITEVGEIENTYTVAFNAGTLASNYALTAKYGKLKVIAQALTDVELVLPATAFIYDGTEHRIAKADVQLFANSQSPKLLIPSSEYEMELVGDVVNAGTVTVSIKDATGGNYTVPVVTGTYAIGKRSVTLTSGSSEKVYDGAPLTNHEVTWAADAFVGQECIVVDATKFPSITDCGTVTNTFVYGVNGATKASNYDFTPVYGTLTVKTKELKPAILLSQSEFTYNGKAQRPVVTVMDGTLTVATAEYDVVFSNDVNAGTATVAVTDKPGKSNPNYKILKAEATYTIVPKEVTLTWNQPAFIYDGNAHAAEATVGSLCGTDKCTVTNYAGTQTAVNVGKYEVTAAELSNANYVLPTQLPHKWQITPKPIDAYTIVVENVTYDAQEQTPDVIVMIGEEVVATTEYTLSYSNNVDCGPATVTVKSSGLGNLSLAERSANFEILPAKLTVTGSVAQEREYDGTLAVKVLAGSVGNVQGSDVISLTAVGSLADANAGSAKAVAVTYTIEGDKRANYVIDAETLSVDIAPRTVEFTSSDATKVYDGAPLTETSVSVTNGSLVGTDGFEFFDFASITNVGSLSNSFSYKAKVGTLAANYSVTTKEGTLTVKAPSADDMTASIVPNRFTYTGLPIEPAVKVTIGGMEVSEGEYTVTYSNNVDVSAGGVCAVAEISDVPGGNFEVAAKSVMFYIDPATLTVTGTVVSDKIYDATTAIGVTVGAVAGIMPADEGKVNVTAVATVADANVGTGKPVSIAYSIVGAKASNYVVANDNSKSVTISRRPITLTSADDTKVYDGTPLSNGSVTISAGSLANGESLAYSNFASITDAGSAANSFSYAMVAGNALSNYDITATYGTLTVTRKPIAKVNQQVSLAPTAFVYDGNACEPAITIRDVNGNTVPASEYVVSYANNVNATTSSSLAEVRIAPAPSGNLLLEENVINFAIEKRTLSLNWGTDAFVYDGTPKSLTVALGNVVTKDKDRVAVSLTEATKTNVGSYQSVATLTADAANANYQLATPNYKSWSIAPRTLTAADYTIEFLDKDLVYNGAAQTPRVQILDLGGNVIHESEYTLTYAHNIRAGVNTAQVSVADNGGNMTLAPSKANFSIGKAPVTPMVSNLKEVKTYDGNSATSADVALTGLFGSDDAGLSATVTYDNKIVGTGKSISATYSITNPDYQLTKSSETLSTEGAIKPKQLTATASVTTDKLYDGTANANVSNAQLSGVIAPDVVTLTAKALYDDAKVGEGKSIALTYAIAGADAANYSAPVSETLTGSIAQPENIFDIQLLLAGNSFVYGEARVGRDKLVASLKSECVGFAAGSFTYTLDGIDAAEGELVKAGNFSYSVRFRNADGVDVSSDVYPISVSRKQLTVSGTVVADKTFDATADAVVVEKGSLVGLVQPDGNKVQIATAEAHFADAAVAMSKPVTVTYTLSGEDADNYEVLNSMVNATINAIGAEFTWSLTANNAVYGDKFGDKVFATYVGTDIPVGGKYTYFVKRGSVNEPVLVGETLVPGTYSVFATYTNGPLEVSSDVRSITFGKATLVPDYDVQTVKVYDGNAQAAVTMNSQGEKVKASDDVTVTAQAAYGNAKVEKNKSIAVTLSLSGANANYYRVDDPAGLMGEITMPVATWTTSDLSAVVYGESAVGTNVSASTVMPGPAGTYAYKVDGIPASVGDMMSAGDHEMTVTYANADGVSVETTFTVSVARRELTVSGTKSEPKEYDGTLSATLAAVGIFDSGCVIGSDDVTIDVNNTVATFRDPSVGEDKAVDVAFALAGTDKENYFVSPIVINDGRITLRSRDESILTVSKPANLIYDGMPKPVTVEMSAEGTFTVLYSVNGTDWSADAPVNASAEGETYKVKVEVSATATEAAATFMNDAWSYSILKASQPAPNVTGKATTFFTTDDGHFVGATTDMEYRAEGEAAYTDVTDPNVDLAAGTYFIRMKADANHHASAETKVVISSGDKKVRPFNYLVQLPADLVYDGAAKPVTVTGDGDITVYYKTDGSDWTTVEPVNVATYYYMFSVDEDGEYQSAEFGRNDSWSYAIVKAPLAAPEVTGAPTTFIDTNDGHFVGATTKMEFRAEAETEFAPIADVNMDLAAGTYFVRIAETENYQPSAEKEVVIAKGPKRKRDEMLYTVTLPADLVYDGLPKPISVSGPGVVSVEYKRAGTEEWSTEAPVDADTYAYRFTVAEDETYEPLTVEKAYWTYAVLNAEQEAPAVSGIPTTMANSADGHFAGATTAMEFRKAGESIFTTISDPDMDLEPGIYEVRYAAKTNYNASGVTTVEIARAPKLIRNVEDYIIADQRVFTYDGTPKGIDVTGDGAVTVLYEVNGEWTADRPTDAGTYAFKFTVGGTDLYEPAEFADPAWALVINNAKQDAPEVMGKPTTMPSLHDGEFIGATEAMEYRAEGEADYKPILDPAMKLPAGNYEVRYAAKPNYDASEPTLVTIAKADRLDRNVDDYTVSAPADNVYDGTGKPADVVGGTDAKEVWYSTDGGNSWTQAEPTAPGHYDVKVIEPETEDYNRAEFTKPEWGFDIIKGEQDAPAVTGTETSLPSAKDGHFVGATTAMEYRAEGETVYAPILDPDMDLAPGKYYVRYSETDNYFASAETEVIIVPGAKRDRDADDYVVTAPADNVYDGTEKPADVAGGTDAKEVWYSPDGGETWTQEKPVKPGHYDVKVIEPETEDYNRTEMTKPEWGFDVAKAEQNAPEVTGIDATTYISADGHFVGATTAMEYRGEGEADFKPIVDTNMNLAPGAYEVRFAETELYNPSAATSVIINRGPRKDRNIDDYVVTPPADLSYDGTEKHAQAQGPGEITIFYSTDGGETWTTQAPIEAGKVDVMISVEGDDEYNPAEFTKPEWSFEIIVRDINIVNFQVDATGYCPRSSAVVPYEVVTGEPTKFRWVIGDDAQALEGMPFEDLTPGVNAFEFEMPDLAVGSYMLSVQFTDDEGRLSAIYKLGVLVNLSSDYIVDIWRDVVSVINKVDLSTPEDLTERFNAYQWYLDGQLIEGATKPYYCQPGGLLGTYRLQTVEIATGDTLFTCPKSFDNVPQKSLTMRVYPNPVVSVINVELSHDDGSEHILRIVNDKGTVVENTKFSGAITQYDMSHAVPGHYVITVDELNANIVKN